MRILSLLTAFLLVLALAACGPPLSKVVINTVPPGGMVQVEETGVVVKDGGTVTLAQGRYRLAPYQVLDSPGSVSLEVDGFQNAQLTVPIGSGEARPSRVEIRTAPAGGEVLIVETNRTVLDGGTVLLPPGRYTLRPSLAGYRGTDVLVDIGGGGEDSILVNCGKGYASLELTTLPEGAAISVDGRSFGKAPKDFELEQGAHRVSLSLDGYEPAEREVFIVAGENQQLAVDLRPIPVSAPVTVVTEPAGAEIFYRGKKVGTGTAALGRLPFGVHSLEALKSLDDGLRLKGTKTVNLTEDRDYRVRLVLSERERRYQGEWLDEKEAFYKENDRYLAERVAKPLLLAVPVGESDLKPFDRAETFAHALHAVLRVGDRVQAAKGRQTFEFWKRHSAPDPDFLGMAEALFASVDRELPWAAENPSGRLAVPRQADFLTDLAFALHRARTDLAFLDLEAGRLAAQEETILRCAADGPLTIVVAAGEQPQIPGEVSRIADGLWLSRVAPGDGLLTLAWREKPDRVLVVSDAAAPFGPMAEPQAQLLINEKQILPIAPRAEVERLVRLSEGPDYETPLRQIFETDGPLAAQIDYSRDEIGPNDHYGDYRRTWLVSFRTDVGVTQRQVTTNYRVVDRKKDFTTDNFLRRNGLGGK